MQGHEGYYDAFTSVLAGGKPLGNPSRTEAPPDSNLILAQLRKIAASPRFRNAERMSRMLCFIVETAVTGGCDRLKETTLGVEVFDLDPSYDPKADPRVRVAACRLRARLEEYYATAGRFDPLHIEIPKGSYVPFFAWRSELAERPRAHAWQRVSIAALMVATIVLAWLLAPRLVQSKSELAPPRLIPFTSLPGWEQDPTISPDGRQVVFAWKSDRSDNFDIYVKGLDSAELRRLTDDPSDDFSPAWSPDGSSIAYVRQSATASTVFLIPAMGGTERRLTSTSKTSLYRRLDWSPDGESLVISEADRSSGVELNIFTIRTGKRRQLTVADAASSDRFPQFSPDGQQVAFVRGADENANDLFVVSVAAGKPRRLTFDNLSIQSVGWMPDGRTIVFSSSRMQDPGLWKVPAAGGTPEAISTIRGSIGQFAFARRAVAGGFRLAYAVQQQDSNIWRAALPERRRTPSRLLERIASTRSEYSPAISPDGSQVAFVSDRSGNPEIWAVDSSGVNARQLTSFRGIQVESPSWSPGGRRVLFQAWVNGIADIFDVSARGGTVRRLISEPSLDLLPRWSQDGRWIYFASNRSGRMQLWKLPASGGDPVQITKNGGWVYQESTDGRFLYYARTRNERGIWRVPTQGGEEIPILDQVPPEYQHSWAVQKRGIYFATPAPGTDRTTLQFYSFAERRITPISTADRELDVSHGTLAVSPDEHWVLFAQTDYASSDICLAEGVR